MLLYFRCVNSYFIFIESEPAAVPEAIAMETVVTTQQLPALTAVTEKNDQYVFSSLLIMLQYSLMIENSDLMILLFQYSIHDFSCIIFDGILKVWIY